MTLPLTEPAWVFLILFAVVLFAPLAAERIRLPGMIGLVVAGAVIGPHGLGMVARDGAVEALGTIGLLYLMFMGGIDLDLEGFVGRRRDSVVFGVLTLLIPLAALTAVGVAVGLSTLAALLVASAFTSHTPITYPILRRLGLGQNPAVTTSMGGTLVAVTGALLVLAVVAAVHTGDTTPTFWALLVVSLAAFLAVAVWGLPRLTRWFFAGLGQDRNVRFTYVLVAAFGMAALADLAGIEPIVGAFLAGLALNRFVSPGGVLMERVQFLGSSLLVPLFLISTGMLVEPAVVIDPWVLGTGAALTVSIVVAKAAAVWPVSRLLGYDLPQTAVMFSLSVGQAAGALAALIVGERIGLIDQATVNAGIIVVLGTLLIAPLVAERAGPRVPQPSRTPKRLGEHVVVPVENPRSSQPLVRLAALLAGPDSGEVIPVNVLGFDAPAALVDDHRKIAEEAEGVALKHGADARSKVRIDSSPTAGILHALIETDATAMLIGWKGRANAREHFFGSVIDGILARSPVPVLVTRIGADAEVARVVVSVTRGDLSPAGRPGLDVLLAVAERMARQAEVPLLVVAQGEDGGLATPLEGVRDASIEADEHRPAVALESRVEAGDVVLLGTPPTRARLGQRANRLARAFPDRTVIAVVPRLGP